MQRLMIPRFLVLASALLLSACVSPVVIDSQPGANLAQYQTYAFVSQAEDGPRELDDQRTLAALEKALAAEGMTEVDADQADVQVKYFFKREQRFDGSSVQFGFGFTRNNVGLGASTPTEGEISDEYKLVVQLIDPQNRNVVWQATSRDKMHDEMSSERRNTYIQKAVEEMFKQYP